MRQGMRPKQAAESALRRIVKHYPAYIGALVTVNRRGEHAGAAYGWQFEYAVRDGSMQDVTVVKIDPFDIDGHVALLPLLREAWHQLW